MNTEYFDWLKQLSTTFKIDYRKYGGLYRLNKDQSIIATTDGVGSKLLLAERFKRFEHIGKDLVAMVVNDCITSGAKPLFLTNYISTKRIVVDELKSILLSISKSCAENDIVLLGGETAEHDYSEHYDLSATCIGLLDNDQSSVGENKIVVGDKIVGLPSNGFHSNGYSLLRKTMLRDLDQLDDSTVEAVMKPTEIYCKRLSSFSDRHLIHGMAHITGGGLFNIGRILPDFTAAVLHRDRFKLPDVIEILMSSYIKDLDVLERNFNMGVGYILVVDPTFLKVNKISDDVIGEIVERKERSVEIVNDYSIR